MRKLIFSGHSFTDSTKDATGGMSIVLFPGDEEGHVEIHAEVDQSMPFSVISRQILKRLGLDCKPCQKVEAQDTKYRTYVAVGKIDLQWHKTSIAKQHSETFYVVDSETAVVLLGGSAFPTDNTEGDPGTYPIGLKPQTPGM